MSDKYPNAPLCPRCGTRQKPLFTGWFCPLECDRKPPPRVDDEWDTPTQPYGTHVAILAPGTYTVAQLHALFTIPPWLPKFPVE